MKYTVRLLAKASNDLEQIYRWLERKSPQGAVSWYAAFQSALTGLIDNPERFGFASDIKLTKMFRERLFKTRAGHRYRLIFTIDADQVHVFRIRGPGQPPLKSRDLRGK